MNRRLILLVIGFLLLSAAEALAGDKPWLEVNSPHFRVLTNGSAADARHVAHEFEQLRYVFASQFPNFRLESGAPLLVFAARDEETAKYFINASAEQVVTRRSVQKERGFFGFGKYEETGRATESENRETRSQDESIKNLPKGQMEILMSDDTRGTLHSLLQVRPPEEVAIPGFQPALYPRMLHSRAESSGANLRFKDPDLARKYRVPSRQVGGFRK